LFKNCDIQAIGEVNHHEASEAQNTVAKKYSSKDFIVIRFTDKNVCHGHTKKPKE